MSSDNTLAARLAFLGLDQDSLAQLRRLRPVVAKSIGPSLDAFYNQVRATPETRKFFSDEAHISHAKSKQEAHWRLITEGDYGHSYVQGVRAIGQAHARLGLEPRWYIGGYARVTEGLMKSLVEEYWPKSAFSGGKRGKADFANGAVVLIKAMLLDMDFAISIYLESLEEARVAAEVKRQAIEQEQTDAMVALTAALANLASGDLSSGLNDNLAPQFDGLKADFNAAVARLAEAVGGVAVAADAIRHGAEEIGKASDDLSTRTEHQAASLEESAAALSELTGSVKEAASQAAQAAKAASGARAEAEHSRVVVGETVAAMNSIEASSTEIANIVGVIDEIAFQTNLLALNAGVEAARAGEAGRGFAVVASEVRALAQRSAEAAKEIKTLIAAGASQVEAGVRMVGETDQALQRIAQGIVSIDGLVDGIAKSFSGQSAGLAQVNIAIEQMDQVTQQNAAMVEEATAATHSLTGETDELVRLVSSFTLAGTRPRPSAAPIRTVQPRLVRAAGGGGGRTSDWEEF